LSLAVSTASEGKPRKRVNELGPPIGRIHSCFSRRNGRVAQIEPGWCRLNPGDAG